MSYISTTQKMSHMKNKTFVVRIPDGKVVLDVKVMTKEKCPLCKKKFHLYQHLKNKHKFNAKQVRDIIQNLKPELDMKKVKDIEKPKEPKRDILKEVLCCIQQDKKTEL